MPDASRPPATCEAGGWPDVCLLLLHCVAFPLTLILPPPPKHPPKHRYPRGAGPYAALFVDENTVKASPATKAQAAARMTAKTTYYRGGEEDPARGRGRSDDASGEYRGEDSSPPADPDYESIRDSYHNPHKHSEYHPHHADDDGHSDYRPPYAGDHAPHSGPVSYPECRGVCRDGSCSLKWSDSACCAVPDVARGPAGGRAGGAGASAETQSTASSSKKDGAHAAGGYGDYKSEGMFYCS